MVDHDSGDLSNRVLHFGFSLRGICQFWQRQRSHLTTMVDTLGLPTAFFTLSARDLQWPELAHLPDVGVSQSSAARSRAVIENPCMADWFFYQRVIKFMDVFYMDIMGPRTTGFSLSTNIGVAHMFMELYGYKMLLMPRISLQLMILHIKKS